MATSYTTSLRLAEPTPGDPLVKNQWGTLENTNMVLIDSAITGTASVNIGGLTSYSLTVGNGSADQARCQFYSFTGALAGDCTVTMPNVPKVVWAANLTTGGHNVILTTGGGTTVTLPNNSTWALIRCDGTNVTNMAVQFSTATTAGAISAGSLATTGVVAALGGVQLTANNTYYYGKDTGGTLRPLMGTDNTNYTLIWSSGAGTRWVNSANSVELMKLTNAGTLTLAAGGVTATGFGCRAGSSGTIRGNLQNIDWNGTAAGLWIDTTFLGLFSYTSDRRIKQDIVDAPPGALDRIMQWRVVNFDYADVGIFKASGQTHLGFIADELQAITPAAVTGAPDEKTPDGDIHPQTLNPISMIAELAMAVQELRREVAALKGG